MPFSIKRAKRARHGRRAILRPRRTSEVCSSFYVVVVVVYVRAPLAVAKREASAHEREGIAEGWGQ